MNQWHAKLLKPDSPRASVLEQVHALFEQQRATWDLFRTGEALLAGIKSRKLSDDTGYVIVQANPGRVISTTAKTDPASIAQRPCFLCPGNLPQPERGVSFGDYIILPNPYPILKYHMTIAFKNHEPQAISGRITDLLAISKALGPEMFIIYNGPRCGASAPDHLHFQACTSEGVPLFEQTAIDSGKDQVKPQTVWGRNMLVCCFRQAGQAKQRIQSIISALKDITGENTEPMINIAALYRDGRYIISIFPRAKHRSSCYYADPQNQISISPAAMEMAGIIVVANTGHFDRVDEKVVHAMFEEVTLGNDHFSRLKEAIA